MPPVESTLLEGAVAKITEFAASYTPQVLIVVGIAVAIGLGIWGFRKVVGLFRSQAK